MATIQGVYVALFGRPADPLGLAYFNTQTNNGANLSAIGNLSGTAEYTDRFKGQTNTQIVNSIYQSLFGHDADLAGLTFFVNQLTTGKQTINTIAINILDGAQGDDKTIVTNKITAADLFTSHLDTGTEVAKYTGDAAAAQGRAFLAPVGLATTTIPTAAATDTSIAAIVAGTSTGGAGQIFTLTATGAGITGIDNIVGTSGDDTIRAIDANSLTSSDIIKAGAGNDVLNISAGALTSGAAPIIDGVETINLTTAAAVTLDLSGVTGTTKIVTAATAAAQVDYDAAQLATTFQVTGSAAVATTVDIKYATSLSGTNDIAKLEVGNAKAGSSTIFTFDNAAAKGAIEGVALTVDKGNLSTVNVNDITKLATITIDGAGHVALAANQTTIVTLDASANTGGVEWTAGALAKAATITGSTFNDTFDLGATTKGITLTAGDGIDIVSTGTGDGKFDLGAGNDTINIKLLAGVNSVTLGAGVDTVVLAGATSSVFSADLAHITTITDFSAADDVLNISAAKVGGFTLLADVAKISAISTGIAALSASATLADAIAVADAQTAVGEATTFQFQGNTYVFGDTQASQDGIGDTIVGVTGNVAISGSHLIIA